MPLPRITLKKKPAATPPTPSKLLKVFDIAIDDLVASADNPNEQTEATFDQLVEGLKEGFDEPIIVVPSLVEEGKYIIVSGHHRAKGAAVAGMKAVPAVIKEGWDETKRQIELVRRNNLRGSMNPEKFTQLYRKLVEQGADAELLKLQMGFTEKDAFKRLYKNIEKNLSPTDRKKLDTAKEKITSVDSLSSTLNNIFKEHGSDLNNGFMVFNYANKQHHHIECDAALHKQLVSLEDECRARDLFLPDVFKAMLSNVDLSNMRPSGKVAARKEQRTPSVKTNGTKASIALKKPAAKGQGAGKPKG